jgi:hypothetical protein
MGRSAQKTISSTHKTISTHDFIEYFLIIANF